MKRALTRASVVFVVGAALGVLAIPAAQAATINCTGTTTFPSNRTGNDLNVPPGATCTLNNQTVGGDITVQPGANLALFGTTVGGSIFSNNPGSFRFDALPSSCSGTTCAVTSLVRGNVTISGTSSVPPGVPKNYMCNGTRIAGNLTLVGSTSAAPWDLGTPSCSFGGNSFGNDVIIEFNAARVDLARSRVGNRLTIQDNTGGGSVVNNTLAGGVTCSNVPAYTASGNKGAGASSLSGGTC